MSAAGAEYWDTLPLGRGVRLVTRDENGMAALAKPAGALSHPNSAKGEARALLTCAYEQGRECFTWHGPDGAERRLWLLNRLDSATSGLVLAASDEAVARAIKEQFARRQVHKVYQALVFGVPREPRQTWRDRLTVERRGGTLRTGAGGNLPAEADFAVVRQQPGPPALALVQLEPRTGRSHQLRVQCARRGLPIVGDQTYGDFRANHQYARATGRKRMFLHSLETSFAYEWAGRRWNFRATDPLPPEFTIGG